jgi:hypothetical protein
MAFSPPLSLTRSRSSSPITYCSRRSSLEYPSPPPVLVDQQYKLSSVYGSDQHCCSMTPPMDSDSSLPSFDTLCQPEWTGSILLHPSSSGAAIPSILSSDYDNYEAYDAALPPPYGVYQAHHAQSHDVHSTTLPPTGAVSRSRDLSAISTVSYASAPISDPLTPRIKMEHAADYSQGLEVSHYPSPSSAQTVYATDSGSYAGSTSGYVSDGQSSWRTSEYQPRMEPDHYYSDTVTNSPFMQDARRPYRAARPRRAPRRLTTREEANFQCEVKGCGKLFSRSYNFKAHMETHDEKREYPFPCLADDCNKKFVRKTDLQRHYQSVHMKERNHKCDYCGRLFARKDTLRRSVCPMCPIRPVRSSDANGGTFRHMEDGCSKRFDIGTLDLRSENCEESHGGTRQPGVGQLNLLGPTPGGLPPMTIPPLGSNSSILTSTASSMRSRDFAADQSQESSWGRQ